METENNSKLEYETPSLLELYVCPVVQGGFSQTPEGSEDENSEEGHLNSGNDW